MSAEMIANPFGNPPFGKAPAGFVIKHRLVDERTGVLAVEGDLDLTSAPLLKRALAERLEAADNRVVVDLSGVRFLDSTALGVLVGVHRRLDAGQRMAISGAQTPVLKIFELSGVAATFHVFPGFDAALEYVRGTGADGTPGGPPLTGDVTLMLGIAATALPFADSAEDQAERWLRLLRRHGEAGAILASLGVSEARVEQPGDLVAERPDDLSVIASITEHATRVATMRHAVRVSTTDVLLAVMHVYGATFDRVLGAHGGDVDELTAQLVLHSREAA